MACHQARAGGDSAAIYILAFLPLAWLLAQAFSIGVAPPQGRELRREEAPRLFALLDKMRRRLSAPPIHKVILDRGFNAAIAQVPRFGPFGGYRNYLVIGLPFLIGMRPSEMVATIAHEYGHLSRGHGKLGAWIFRQRQVFAGLHARVSAQAGRSPLFRLMERALDEVAPRFNAYTLVASRQHEFEADVAAAHFAGSKVNATALIRGELLGAWIRQAYWPGIYRHADMGRKPPFLPYGAMRLAFRAFEKDWSTPEALHAAGMIHSEVTDSHPSLKERLDAMGRPLDLPQPLDRNALDAFLGARAAGIVREFDQAWWREKRAPWRAHFRRVEAERADRMGD